MQKLNIPKTILITTLFISFALITGLSVFGFSEIKKTRDLPVDFIEPVKPVEDNNNQEPVEPTESVELETYEAELFVEAKWGSEEGEVGIFVSGGDAGGAGPVYGPQSFDVDDKTGYLYLLDSVNERVLEYDGNGKYLRDFPIACGGTGDIRISPDGEFLYVFSWRCEAIYKYKISGEFLEEYKVLPNEKKRPGLGSAGLGFDENGNVMLDLKIENYIDWSGFYQIGETGNEWKENYYKGYISRDGKELYYSEFADARTVDVFSKSRDEGVVKKLFEVKLPISDNSCHFIGSDKKNNIYIESLLGPLISEMYFEKYTKSGELLVGVDIFEPLRKIYNVTDNKILPNYFYTYPPLSSIRVSHEGSVYYMFTFENEGLRLFKYSKVE